MLIVGMHGKRIATFINDPEQLGKAQVGGYDLSLLSLNRITPAFSKVLKEKTIIDPESYKPITPYEVEGRTIFQLFEGAYSITFDQGIKVPLNTMGFIKHRSSIARCGAIVTSGIYDPGFEVENMGGILIVKSNFQIELHARIAQFWAIRTEGDKKGYDGQWQKEKDVK
jgi:deoxycytidine triphosphate deaminase